MKKYPEWKKEYYHDEKVDLTKYLSKNDFFVLEKLGIEVLKKVYTENEFELLYSKVISSYDEKDKLKKSIIDFGVDEIEFNSLIENLDKINEEFDF